MAYTLETGVRNLFIALLACGSAVTLRADLVSSVTLSAGQTVDLETGLTASSGGDLQWTGSSLVPQGSATVSRVGLVGTLVYSGFTQANVQSFGNYSSAALASNVLPVNEVVFVHDNAGHYGKLQVTARSTDLSFNFTTFGATAGPSITKILNNYSFTSPGVPNYGIAPGSLFVVIGTALNSQPLSALQASTPPGMPITLNNTSITVTVNGTVVHPGLYYTSPTAVAGVLPSNTPIGAGTLTLTNGVLSDTSPILVVQSALGLDTFTGSGTGLAVVQDANFNLLTPANPAKPGQVVILWGSGVGPDTTNDDRTYPLNQNNLTNLPMDFFVGGKKADIAYRGRSQFPGVDQIVITIPPDLVVGCGVSAWAQTGATASNFVTIPVSSDGSPCTDSVFTSYPTTSNQVNLGTLVVEQEYYATGAPSQTSLVAGFAKWNTRAFFNDPTHVSVGGCVVFGFSNIIGPGGSLDAGDISVQTPNGANLSVPQFAVGGYELLPIPDPDFQPSGTYTFTGSGSKINGGVGSFQASVDYPSEITWDQMNTLTTVTRSQGLTISWNGGDPNTYILISGGSAPAGQPFQAVDFECTVKTSDGHFDIPTAVLNSMPAGTGNIGVKQNSFPKQSSAAGLDYLFISTVTAFTSKNLTFQ